ncbi:MAG: substrate-binding periplasmic protein [Vampirovibrionia bacterium]
MQELEKIKKINKLRVGISLQNGLQGAPWSWRDDQTQAILGFEADIARALAKKLTMHVDFVPLDNHRLIIGLIKNSCDIGLGALRPQNKMAGINYSIPYYSITQRLITPEGSIAYDLADLKGDKVGVLKNSIGEYIIQQENTNLPSPITICSYEDVLHLFAAIQFKEISAIFIDSPIALWYTKTNLEKKLHVSDTAYKSGNYAIALRSDDKDLIDNVNNALKEINTHEILDKYGLWDNAQENY